jgi:uncharacterized protein (DUF1697 family)
MSRLIAFLRAINAGSHPVKMVTLRKIFESLGFSGVETYIASGNVMFESDAQDLEALEKVIEDRLREELGYEVATFIRTDKELVKTANYQPFQASELEGDASLNIAFLSKALDAETRKKLIAMNTDTDEFRSHRRELYWLRRKKQGTLVYSTVPLEKTLDQPFTIRSAGTVKKIAAKFASSGS